MKKLFLALLTFALAVSCSSHKNDSYATGTFDASEIIVSSEVAGMILRFDVNEGSVLTKGMLIANIDSTQYYLQKQQLIQNIAALKANIPAVSTQLAPLKEQLEKQRQEQKRLLNLHAEHAATDKQLDDINSAVNVLEKQLAAQENSLRKSVSSVDAQIAALYTQVEQVDDRLKKCRILAPIDGTVLSKYAQEGELSAAGKPLLKIADVGNVFLKAYLTSDQLIDVRLGQELTVRADFGGGNYRSYKGKISWISDKSEFTPKNIVSSNDRANMVYAIKIAVQNDGYIKLGMYGDVKLK